ncbi:MAG TPA: OsmC family peroxiredoxin [Sedimenticola sp.]|nr:OsmC family peroxiredoxin [Sedimenticola sp.]
MASEEQFSIEMEHLEGYEFRVRYDLEGVDDLRVDEPPPLGGGRGPNPSRLIATAAANCLGASLLYCVTRRQPPPGGLKATATCTMTRDPKGRLRIGGIAVRLEVGGELEQAVRLRRCLALFEAFCVASASLREGFPVQVAVVNAAGEVLHQGPAPEADPPPTRERP